MTEPYFGDALVWPPIAWPWWQDVSEETHDRVMVNAGNASHVRYALKGEPLDGDSLLAWKPPGAPGWHCNY